MPRIFLRMIDFRRTLWENIRDGNEQCADMRMDEEGSLLTETYIRMDA